MLVGAALGGVRRQLALAHRARNKRTVAVDDGHCRAAHLGDIALLEEDEAPRHRQQRRYVRCHEVLVHAEADDDRAALARENQPFRLVLAHHHERIGTLELGDRGTHRLEEVVQGLQVQVHAVGDDLRIGLGGELVAAPHQVRPQVLVVLDDAVVHDGEPVARDVRMGVALARHPVGRPAGVGDADLAVGGGMVERLIEHAHLADRTQPGEVLRAVEDCDAGRVVAAILEPPQSLHQDRHDVSLRDCSDDSAHGSILGDPG